MQPRSPRNRTLSCSCEDMNCLRKSHEFMQINSPVSRHQDIKGRLIQGDIFKVAGYLPHEFVHLLVLDPPYNLSKDFNGHYFQKKKVNDYRSWFEKLIDYLKPVLTKDATVYVCSDWRTSGIILPVLESKFRVRNRITWEREKGRGAKRNWKNNTEDIWFCTVSDSYYFDVESVKLRRKVLAPYKIEGKPKDWSVGDSGNFRLTHPSNIWTDLTVPFWSMPENTPHPTQKPEKLIAKLILASSREGDWVFDPFLGSGTTAVVAEKLYRRWCGVEINGKYLCWALKRLNIAKGNPKIQGYDNGVFLERNTAINQKTHMMIKESRTRTLL